jgi:hypothetical protein
LSNELFQTSLSLITVGNHDGSPWSSAIGYGLPSQWQVIKMNKKTSWAEQGKPYLPGECRKPRKRSVLVKAFKRNPRVKDPEKLATDADRICRSYAHNGAGEFDQGEYEELVAVAAIAAVIASGMTTEQAINDYRTGKYPGTGTKYVFGITQADIATAPVMERGDRESKLEWSYAHQSREAGTHTRPGKADDNGNTTAMQTAMSADTEGGGIEVPWFMRPYDPPHCEKQARIDWHLSHPELILGVWTSLKLDCPCDNLVDNVEAQKVVLGWISQLLRRILNGYREKHPDHVRAFELYYMSEFSPSEAARMSGMDRKTLEYRAKWMLKQLQFEQFADYICPPLEGEHKRNYEAWAKRMEQPHTERGKYLWYEGQGEPNTRPGAVKLSVKQTNGHKKTITCAIAGDVVEGKRNPRVTDTQIRVDRMTDHGAYREARESVEFIHYVYRLDGGKMKGANGDDTRPKVETAESIGDREETSDEKRREKVF